MCKEFYVLVEQTEWRYIAQCEHNTVHLRWDTLTLNFQPEAFLKFGRQILQEHVKVSRLFPVDEASFSKKKPSNLCLRVNTVVLELPPSEMPELLMALRIACALLEYSPATLPPTRRRSLSNAPLAIQPCPRRRLFSLTDQLN